MDNDEKQVVMTASAQDGEQEELTSEQAAAIEWWSVPKNRGYMMQAMRKAAEAACEAVCAICLMISAAAVIIREAVSEEIRPDEEETEGGVQHDHIE